MAIIIIKFKPMAPNAGIRSLVKGWTKMNRISPRLSIAIKKEAKPAALRLWRRITQDAIAGKEAPINK